MKCKIKFLALFLLMMATRPLLAEKVGLLITATGKYDCFVDPLISSARKYFCPSHEVTYFVFTDSDKVSEADDVVRIFQMRLGWPYDTLLRNAIYYDNREYMYEQDYLFAIDADMLFVGTMGDEIFGERVATLHPCYTDRKGTYETNPNSKAYVSRGRGTHYFAGGFFGGTRDQFLNIAWETSSRIYDDLDRGIIALWHDESHWNRFCIDVEPTVILSASYCWPDNWYSRNKSAKLLCLTKDHAEFRKP